MSRALVAASRSTASTFSRDIAYSASPTASRASLRVAYSRTRTILRRIVNTIANLASMLPRSPFRPTLMRHGDDLIPRLDQLLDHDLPVLNEFRTPRFV